MPLSDDVAESRRVASDALRALAEPRRREILQLVGHQELAAGEIAAAFDVTRPAVSQHLTVLKTAGLLDERRDGTRRLYRARPEGLSEIRELLDTMWASALDTARRIVEQDRGGPVTTQPPAPNSAAPHGPGPSGSSAEAN
jgi:DNA-binding transcriptional ArsR family regulator